MTLKNFPHQFNDLSKLHGALEIVRRLISKNTPLTDESFGETLTREGIYSYRDKTLSIEEYLELEKKKPRPNRGYLTVARDIRRLLELLNLITLSDDKFANLTTLGKRLLDLKDELERIEVWKDAFLNFELKSSEGEASHPYKILIRLVNARPGLETSKLMLALEVENDSEEEFKRILDLSEKTIEEISSIIDATEASVKNAVKILPAVAEQLGHIKRVDNFVYPADNIVTNYPLSDFGVEDEIEEYHPFDPEKISIDKKVVTMDTCLRRLEQETIFLSPDFQRNEVWTNEQKCRLIESLMLKIPIPMFYVSADEKGTLTVVDGLQRLSTIKSFILGDEYLNNNDPEKKGDGFRLKNLEFWGPEYDGHTFNELPVNIQNRILETEFTFTIINPGTPEEVKRNVFKRINTGGTPLTAQEIRHSLYTGASTKLLKELSELDEFLTATDSSISSDRMMDRELILRFLAFSIRNYNDYPTNNDMDTFLSDTMRIINIMPSLAGRDSSKLFTDTAAKSKVLITDIVVLKHLFIKGMKHSNYLFEKHAFRKSYGEKRRTRINKSLFEVWSVLFSTLSEDQFNKLSREKDSFLEEYSHCLDDDGFENSISRDSLKHLSVKYRFETLTNLLNNFLQ